MENYFNQNQYIKAHNFQVHFNQKCLIIFFYSLVLAYKVPGTF